MSSSNRDNKVSKPTEADFIHGFSQGAARDSGTGLLLAVVAGLLMGKVIRRPK